MFDKPIVLSDGNFATASILSIEAGWNAGKLYFKL